MPILAKHTYTMHLIKFFHPKNIYANIVFVYIKLKIVPMKNPGDPVIRLKNRFVCSIVSTHMECVVDSSQCDREERGDDEKKTTKSSHLDHIYRLAFVPRFTIKRISQQNSICACSI